MATKRQPSRTPERRAERVRQSGRSPESDDALLRAIIEYSDDAIIAKNVDGIITSWNQGAERMFQFTAEEVLGKSIYLIIPAELIEEERTILERIRRGERIHHFETMRQRKDGSKLDVSLTISPISDPNGTIIGASKIARDISDRKRAEREHRQSAEFLRSVIESSPDCIKVLDLETHLLSINESGATLLEIDDPKAFLKTRWLDLWSGEARVRAEAAVAAARAGGHGRFQVFSPTRKATPRWWDIIVSPLRDSSGQPYRLLAVSRDITEQRNIEQQLRERIRLLNLSFDAILVRDPSDRITFWSRGAEQLYGWSVAEALGNISHELLQTQFPRPLAEIIATLRAQGRWEGELIHHRRDGQPIRVLTRWVLDSQENGSAILETNNDVTQQKKVESELNVAREELVRHATRLEQTVAERTRTLQETILQLESFSYTITHDMRGPLRAISGFASLLEHDYAGRLDESGRELLARIASSANRLDRLIQDVLNFSRLTRNEIPLEPVRLEPLIRKIITEYPDIRQHQERIRVDCADCVVRANLAGLTQSISNLLSNAVKFVPRGTPPEVSLSCERRGENIRLWVEDKGIGIRSDLQSKIFEVFHRLHHESEYPGTGIGLAIVKKAVQRMGGTLGVESAPGNGSRFWVEFPSVNGDVTCGGT